jgi:hypothetical protein
MMEAEVGEHIFDPDYEAASALRMHHLKVK